MLAGMALVTIPVFALHMVHLILFWHVHFHGEAHSTAQRLPLGIYLNFALIRLNKSLAENETHPRALYVDIFRTFKLAKKVEKLLLLIGIDAPARVNHGHTEYTGVRVEGRKHDDFTSLSLFAKFQRIFHQVYKDLGQAHLITTETRLELIFNRVAVDIHQTAKIPDRKHQESMVQVSKGECSALDTTLLYEYVLHELKDPLWLEIFDSRLYSATIHEVCILKIVD